MTEEERKDYLKYIENYTINDLADEFNTQNFVIQDKDKFNEILLYYHFKQNEEIEQLKQENKELKEENEFLKSEIEEAKRIFQKYLEYIDERDERINKAIKYIENNSLYEEKYDYDYEENSYLSGIDDKTAKKDLLEILREEDVLEILKEVE